MRYIVCGANSVSGRLYAKSLVDRASGDDIVLVATYPEELADRAGDGVRIVYGGYNDRRSLERAFAGGDVLLLNNCLQVRSSVEQHRNVINVAKSAGVRHIVYTSSVGAHPLNPRPSAAVHVATERMLWECGLPFTIMRNQLFSEYAFHWGVDQLMRVGKCYVLGDGGYFYAPVSRADIADCGAAIVSEPEKHERVVYEITGPDRLNMHDLVSVAGEALNIPVACESITEAQIRETFESRGVPRDGQLSSASFPFFLGWEELVTMYVALQQGYLDVRSSHVQMILDRQPVGIEDVFKARAKRFASS